MCLQLLNALGAVAASSSSGAGMTFGSLERIPSFVWWLATWTGLYYAMRVFLSRTHANRLVSSVHACIVGSGGVVLLLRTAALEPVAQFLELRADTEYYGTAFLTYLCCDLLYELAEAEQLDYVSLFHHASSKPEFGYKGDFTTFLKVFLSGNAENGSWFQHVCDWHAASTADPDRVLWLTYEGMIRHNLATIVNALK